MIKKIKQKIKNIKILYFTINMFHIKTYIGIESFIPFSYYRCIYKKSELSKLGYYSYIVDTWYGYDLEL